MEGVGVITAALLLVGLTLVMLTLIATVIAERLRKINVTLATQASVHLAYLAHAEDEELRGEARAIQLLLLKTEGFKIKEFPEGEVEKP